MTQFQERRWRRIRDRPEMLQRERELAAAIAEVEGEQRRLAERYAELRRELVELHGLLWAPDREGSYRKTRAPNSRDRPQSHRRFARLDQYAGGRFAGRWSLHSAPRAARSR